MYVRAAIVTVSIEETAPLDQGERGLDRDPYFPDPVSKSAHAHTLLLYYHLVVSRGNFALGTKNGLTGYGRKPDRLVQGFDCSLGIR